MLVNSYEHNDIGGLLYLGYKRGAHGKCVVYQDAKHVCVYICFFLIYLLFLIFKLTSILDRPRRLTIVGKPIYHDLGIGLLVIVL
jgi:hypothetical protein